MRGHLRCGPHGGPHGEVEDTIGSMPTISAHAVVSDPRNLAEDVVVGAFSYIGPDVRIGPGTQVHNNVTIDGDVCIGRGNQVYPFAVIGRSAQPGEPPARIRIGDRNSIREHVVVSAGLEGQDTCIGSENLIMTGCYIGPGVVIEDQVILVNYTQLAERTRVEKCAHASGFTGTRPGAVIGAYAFTSGYAGIDRDAPPFSRVQGYPFKVRGVNTVKLKRKGFSEEQIAELEDAFRELFNGSGEVPAPDRLRAMASRCDLGEHVRYLVAFLERAAAQRRPDDQPDQAVGGGRG